MSQTERTQTYVVFMLFEQGLEAYVLLDKASVMIYLFTYQQKSMLSKCFLLDLLVYFILTFMSDKYSSFSRWLHKLLSLGPALVFNKGMFFKVFLVDSSTILIFQV